MALRTLGLHVAALFVAAGLAYSAWNTETEKDGEVNAERVEVWAGNPTDLKSASFVTDDEKTTVELRKDEVGAFCIVSSEKERPVEAPKPPEKLDSKPTKERTTKRFISVTGCEKLRETIAPLLAVRSIGVVPKARFVEFGLDDPNGTFTAKLADTEHRLTFGGMTPGGGDHYALDPASGRVYAIAGEMVRLFEYADSRLAERSLHTFEADLIEQVAIAANNRQTRLRRMSGKVDGWARAGTPTVADETAGNWMSKLGRVRLSEFAEKLDPKAQQIARVDYRGASTDLGFVELHRVGEGAEAQYWARSETTRWYGSVLRSIGEQLEQDLAAVLK